MIDRWTLGTILLMAGMTYLTRIGGYLVLGGRELSPRTMTLLDAAPGCVPIAVIAPAFVPNKAEDLIAFAITGAAASRLSLLPTVLIGIAAAGLLRAALS